MKISVFNGSPRGEKSNTHIMVESFLKGADEAGAHVEEIYISKYKINNCKSCWEKTPGRCTYDDDMNILVDKVKASDVVGFATPVFVDNVTGIMKNFMDRLIVLGDPRWMKDEFGECRHVMRYATPNKMIIFSNCGYPEQSHFQVLRLLFRRMARNMGWELCGEIYRAGGGLLSSRDESIIPFINKYKSQLIQAGREFAINSCLSADTIEELEKPILPVPNYVDLYFQKVNEICDKRAAKFVQS